MLDSFSVWRDANQIAEAWGQYLSGPGYTLYAMEEIRNEITKMNDATLIMEHYTAGRDLRSLTMIGKKYGGLTKAYRVTRAQARDRLPLLKAEINARGLTMPHYLDPSNPELA
jgi:hypothetical protein